MVSLGQRVAKCDHLSKVLTVFCSSFVSVTQAQKLQLKRQLGDCYWVILYDEPRTPDFTVYHGNAFCFDDNCLCVGGGDRGALCVLVRWHPLLAIAKRSTDLCSFHCIHQVLCVIFVGLSPHYCGPNPRCYPLFKNWFICWISSYSY